MFENSTDARIGEITKDWLNMQEIGMAVGETAKNLTRQSFVAYLYYLYPVA